MIRILQIVDSMNTGGIQAFLMNMYRNIDRSKIQFDFLIFREGKQVYEDEILGLGGIIYKVPGRKHGILKNRRAIRNFFKQHTEYTVVHYNASSLSDVTAIREAERQKIPVRIIHSHSTNTPSNKKIHRILHGIHKGKISSLANVYLACSDLAAFWMYSGTPAEKEYRIIKNGVDIQKFSFSPSIREKIRKQLEVADNFVLGHVGRFSAVKNHRFIIDVFAKLRTEYPQLKPKLVLVGDGELLEQIEIYAQQREVASDTSFLGRRNDVADLMQAFDHLILPSFYEGFPVTAIEAQAAGLPCTISATITKETIIKENARMLDINGELESWVKDIGLKKRRITDNQSLYINGFDIQTTVNQLSTIYLGETK